MLNMLKIFTRMRIFKACTEKTLDDEPCKWNTTLVATVCNGNSCQLRCSICLEFRLIADFHCQEVSVFYSGRCEKGWCFECDISCLASVVAEFVDCFEFLKEI